MQYNQEIILAIATLHAQEIAKREGLPIAWVLAGGYTEDTSKVVQVHLNTFKAAFEVHAD